MLRRSAVLLSAVLLSAGGYTQTQTATQATTNGLLEKAHVLEIRGRMDMASQTWQQVLLADPNNVEALGGLARAAKLNGDTALANTYLGRLRAINPNDPNINRVENMLTQQTQVAQLQQAGKYAQAGQYSQAMTIYRQVFGNTPPAGDWALAYYETESATDDGRAHAIAGLRSMVEKYPSDSRYQIALGRILTYNPATRVEGRRLLERHPKDPQAVESLRQSLVWDAKNPASSGDIKSYLARHNDAQLAQALKAQPQPARTPARSGATRAAGRPVVSQESAAPLDEMASGNAGSSRERDTEDQAAYRALNSHRMEEADALFKAILAKYPDDARALAGLGYVRMQQSNFGGAISFLEQAKQDGAKDAGLEAALATSRFWYTMGEGSSALSENDLTTAEKQYQAALAMRPSSPEALEGLGGTLLKAQQPEAAIQVFERYVRVKSTAAAWRGLFMAQYGAGNAVQALATERKIPPAIRAQLMRDPDFLRTLASAYSAVGRDADAQRVLRSALELPFPVDAGGLKAETQLQYASLLQQANHVDQAAGLFRQVLAADPANTAAWQGLVRAEHALKRDQQAMQTLESMPPSSYDAAMRDPGFETTVAAIYQDQNKLDVAQSLLEKAIAQQTSAGQSAPVAVQVQLAGIYLARNNPKQAYPIYRQVLTENPDRPDAWKGLLTALHATGRDQEALAQVQQIPQPTRRQLENDVEYLQAVGSIYNGLGQPQQAMVFLTRVQQHYAQQHAVSPADIDIQNAYLLFNGMSDTGLYRQLMVLGGRPDLSDEQRRTVQTIWTLWAVRRANQAAASGNVKRSLAILNASARAFPDNPAVLKALASGYARAGLSKQAVAIFKSQDMTSATAGDYKAAVGAALAAGDNKSAETWLRYGLDMYPKDAQMLILGAKFEQARGDSGRAADYFKASLAAMPPLDPGAELADELSRPGVSSANRLPNGTQSQDIAALLAPGASDPGSVAAPEERPAAPYLPNYGNAYGTAPVQVPGAQNYTGSSNVVPSYMSNPGARGRSAQPRLKDYVPQATMFTPPPIEPTDRVPYGASSQASTLASGSGSRVESESFYPREDAVAYRQTQIRRLTRQAQADVTMPTTAPQQEEFGPFVPYVPGQRPTTVAALYRPSSPEPLSESRNAVPTAHYVANARGARGTSSSHPDIAAAQAASIRREQSNPNSMAGQSHPPSDDSTFTAQNTLYGQESYNAAQSGGQVAQPRTIRRASAAASMVADAQNGQSGDSYGQQYPQPGAASRGSSASGRRRRAAESSSSGAGAGVATGDSGLPGLSYPGVRQPLSAQPYPTIGPAQPSGNPPTDADLVAKSVPPLRGGYDPNAAGPPNPGTQREQTERDLATLEGSYSGWIGGTGVARYRSGTAGLDRLFDLESPFEASAVLGKTLRVSVVPRAVFLNSGVLDTTAFQNVTGTVPILGTLPANALNAPQQQFASGVGGELQISTANFGLAAGYTPYEFLVSNYTGRARWRPFGGRFSLFAERDSVKDTQLSYAGLRDPGSATPVYPGNIWGGVISSGGGFRIDLGGEKAGFYVSADGAALTGYHVLENRKYEGTMGAYFRAHSFPGYGSLNVGGTFFGMHFDHNERGMTYGQGGYFSPNAYFLAAVPVTFNGHYKTDWHYVISGSVGVQTFQEEFAPFFPLDRPLQTGALSGCSLPSISSHTCGQYPINSNTGVNYGLNSEGSYRIADHWYVGGFITGNNTNNYNAVSGGFFFRYLFRPQFPAEDYPTGLFPVDGFRPIRVP